MLPQFQLQNTPFCYSQHTWQLPTLLKVYISVIWHMHVSAGLHAQFNSQLTPRLQLILKDIQRNQAISHPQRACLPITLQIMQSINYLLTNQPHSYANILIWAACCLAFFGFLQVSEFTIPSNTSYDKECHLSPADISIDDCNNPQLLKVKIKQ